MGDLITQWLREKLGVIVDVHDDAFLKMVLNGQLIALLLRRYNIITEEQLKSLEDTTDSNQITKKIILWLKTLDPTLEEDAVNCFVKAKLSATIKLFYKLYLVLKGKDQLHFTAQSVVKQKLRTTNTRFQCTKISDEVQDTSSIRPHLLSQPLQDHYHIIQWHKDRYKALLQRCKEARSAYIAFLDSKQKKITDHKLRTVVEGPPKSDAPELETFDVQSLCETYDDLKEQEKKALEMNVTAPNPKLAETIVKRLKQKYKREQEERTMKAQMETILVTKIWNETVRDQEQAIEMELSKKILKQSNYEKQMASKIFEIREQKYIMAENRDMIQREIQKRMDDALLEYVFVKQKESGEERCRYYFERERLLELHRRIYNEKLRLLKERRQNMCKDVLKDIVDISLKHGEYKEAFNEEMSPKMKKDLADLFVQGKSIFDIVEDVEAVVDCMPLTNFEEEIFSEEIDRQNAIDARNFEDYCNFLWPYEVETHAPDFLERLEEIGLAKNILGHIIFRLLLTKYPKPPSPTPPEIPEVSIAVCIANIPDTTILPILEKLLLERKIKIVQLEEAINYCLAAYKEEVSAEAPESQFVDETQKALEDTKKKKGGKDKKRNARPYPKGQKPKGKDKGKKTVAENKPEEIPPFRDEMVQTPRVFPCEEHVMSQKAELGKLAYEVLNLGEALSDEILVKMFVEYLKTLKGVYGWVLVNYPQNFQQATFLEEALTAKKVPTLQSQYLEPQNVEKYIPDKDTSTSAAPTQEDEACSEDVPVEKLSIGNRFEGIKLEDIPLEVLSKPSAENDPTETPTSDPKESLKIVSVSKDEVAEPKTVKASPGEIVPEALDTKLENFADLSVRQVEQNTLCVDKNAVFRISFLLTNPDMSPTEEDYNSYLTSLIVLKQDIDSLTNPHVIDMEEEKLDALTPLDIFYQNQGCYYTLYYKTLDFAAIKHLGKLIIGEYSIPPKTSVQIFGDTVLYLEGDVVPPDTANVTRGMKKGQKKEKEKPKGKLLKDKSKEKDDKKKKESKNKEKVDKGKKDKGGARNKKRKKGKIDDGADVMIERADKETQIPTPAPESVVEFVEMIEPIPGTKEYIYVDLAIPDFLQICLATLWENIEEVYVYDFRELFFRKRLLWKTVVPYMDFIRRYLRDYIARPDEKQFHMFNFQRIYNSIDADLRDDDEMKGELHCRIYEFREKLWEICDQRMREAEGERNNMILQDWIAKQASELTNIYITAMQLEIDRCVDTVQLLNDYYSAMVTKMPCEGETLGKALLNQICLTANMEFQNALRYKEFVRDMLKDCNFVLEDTPYHEIIRKDLSVALENAALYEEVSKKEIAKIEVAIQPGRKVKPAKDTKQVKNKKKWPKFTDPEPEVREQGPKMITEWSAAINGEKLRTDLRLNMLLSLFMEDIKDMLNCAIKTFHGLYTDIKERYEKELKSIERCCAVLLRAVEEEVPIQPQLILTGDSFYIDPDVMLFADVLPAASDVIVEYVQPESFTIHQLEKFMRIMSGFAPRSVIPEQAFLFILQDMIVYEPEDGSTIAVPEIWKKLPFKSINRLTYEFYGSVENVDWKDFVLYNLCVPFPTEEEMMDMRRQFRDMDEDKKEFVYDYQYHSVRFWFEKQFDKTNPQEADRLKKIKKILFEMYALNNQTVNYTQLLLGFCKGVTTREGVAKALALSLGKLVCHQQDIGEAFVETLRERKRQQLEEELQFQLMEKEKRSTVGDIIESFIDTTVHECDSCYLTEVNDEDQLMNEAQPEELAAKSMIEDAYMTESMEYLYRLMKTYRSTDMYEEEYYGDFFSEDFSNVEIGFEPYKNPPLVYYLLFDVIYAVLMASMPWKGTVQNLGEPTFRQKLEAAYEEMKNPEFDDIVLMHEFLNSTQFEEVLRDIQKFKIINPRKVIRNLLGENV